MPQSHTTHHSATVVGMDGKIPNEIDLLSHVFGQSSGQLPIDAAANAREYARDLGLGRPGGYWGFTWRVLTHKPQELGFEQVPVPIKYPHSGNFDWIGRAKDGIPQYLWDSVGFCTVEATPERLQRYVAVSWTWGRYQLRNREGEPAWRRTRGTKWRVPQFDHVPTPFAKQSLDRLTYLKHVLRRIKAFRYFWVDILCIDQGDDQRACAEREQEIAKQAHIFAKATASIAYLWTLNEQYDHDLSRAVAAFGALLSTTNYLRPDQQVFDRQAPSCRQVLPSHKEWPALLNKLKNDHWFTSLWALQEMVLFPSAWWMTQDGGFCTVNGHPVTTRLIATTLRLLLALQRLRDHHWDQAEIRYRVANKMSVDKFEKLQRELCASEHEQQKSLLQFMADQGTKGIGYKSLVVESTAMSQIPSIIKNRRADRRLEQEVSHWVQWSIGTSGVDISLYATRTAILVAGNNREVIDNQSKEYALLAALKISDYEGLMAKGALKTDGNYFSANLLNLIMQAEGPRFFDVNHGSFARPFQREGDAALDTSDWATLETTIDFFHVERPDDSRRNRRPSSDSIVEEYTKIIPSTSHLITSAPYQRKGLDEFASVLPTKEASLTDMSPCSAQQVNDITSPFSSQFSISPENITGWHMHDRGMLHIPSHARAHQVNKKPNVTRLNLLTNGTGVRYLVEQQSDLRHIWRTQPWLQKSLGYRPKFLFLPLYVCVPTETKSSYRFITDSYVSVQKEQMYGIILVGKTDLQKDTSMTCWYKFGTYHGHGPLRSLGWKGGIIVTSPYEDERKKLLKDDKCQRLALISHRLRENYELREDGYEFILIDEVLGDDMRSRSSFSSSVAPSASESAE